jgi:mono/diheme cytochrome c family protein
MAAKHGQQSCLEALSVATDEEPTAPQMPAFGWQLNDAQVAAVITYIRNNWSHAAPPVTERGALRARIAGAGAGALAASRDLPFE